MNKHSQEQQVLDATACLPVHVQVNVHVHVISCRKLNVHWVSI